MKQSIITFLAVLLILSVGAAISRLIPDTNSVWSNPFERSAAGNQVKLQTGTVQVEGVEASSQAIHNRIQGISRNGIFLIVTVKFFAEKSSAGLIGTQLKAVDGRTFGGHPVVGSDGCFPVQAGFWVRCPLVFEVDKAALKGIRLVVFSDPRSSLKETGTIDLGIDQTKAGQMAGVSKPILVKDQETGVNP